MKWIKCAEKLPAHNKYVLLLVKGAVPDYDIGYLNLKTKVFMSGTTDGCCRYPEYEKDEITYWTEIEPPQD